MLFSIRRLGMIGAFSALLAVELSAATPVSGVTTFDGGFSGPLVAGVATGAGISASDVYGWDFHLVTIGAEQVGLHVEDLAWGSGNGVQYYPGSGNPVSMDFFDTSSNGGDVFSLLGFAVTLSTMNTTDTSLGILITGYLGGDPVVNTTRTFTMGEGATQTLESVDLSSLAGFQGIDRFRIEPAPGFEIGYLGIDNINAVNFVPEPSALLLAAVGGLFGWRRRR